MNKIGLRGKIVTYAKRSHDPRQLTPVTSLENSVNAETRLGAERPVADFRQRQGLKFRHRFQTSSWAHPASYTMGTEGSFSGGKAAGM